MPRISLAGFRDQARQPRFIIWTGTISLFLIAALITLLGVTSTRWFCAEVCHKVQDDTIISYSHSPHDRIQCLACHMPVDADPITFLIHKAGALGELYATLTNNYELPLNPDDEVALSKSTMPEETCTQCHDLARSQNVPKPGIIIDHEIHSKAGYQCTVCHNRVAHVEDFKLTLPGNRKHADFMTMDACFRCHGLLPGAKAPGQCTVCHPQDFPRKPAYHLKAGFFPKGHGELGKQAIERVAEAEKAERQSAEKPAIPPLGTVNTCYTCHVKATFCDRCHGLDMPHPAEFRVPKSVNDPAGHPAFSRNPATAGRCEFCHKQSKTFFCVKCHHGSYVNWTFNPQVPWQQQHAQAVDKNGTGLCLGKCHDAKFCSDCHDRLKVRPTSHKDRTWLHGASPLVSKDGRPGTAATSARHARAFLDNRGARQGCALCHGNGGPNATFCKDCHKLDVPHPKDKNGVAYASQPGIHPTAGKRAPATCLNCHQFKELCSNCHHAGATNTTPWLIRHPESVRAAGGPAGCLGKCHKRGFCNACHTARKVPLISRKPGNGLHRARVHEAG